MLIGFIKSPIFTRYYSTNDFGKFALINTTYSYINLFAFSWSLACIYRFYFHEKKEDKLDIFHNNIIFLLFIGFLISSVASLIFILMSNDVLIRKLIWANYINLITTAITTYYLIVLRLEGKAFFYNIFTILISILSCLLLFFMAFIKHYSIDAMINSSNIINGIFIIFIIFSFFSKYKIKISLISIPFIKKCVAYGFGSTFINIGLILLISGDRYAIKIFSSTDKVGIYNQIYNLAQISIVAFITILENILSPYYFKLFEDDVNNDKKFYNFIFISIICLLPFVIYFSLYSKEIATLLLGKDFRVGYTMMPYIMLSSFIYFLVDFHNTRLKFKNKLKKIIIGLLIACGSNVILNLILIPKKGYQVAAITTLISYVLFYIFSFMYDTNNLKSTTAIIWVNLKKIKFVFIILIIQILFHYIIKSQFISFSIIYSIIEGSMFLITYIILIYLNSKNLFDFHLS